MQSSAKCIKCKLTLKQGVQIVAALEMIICAVIIAILTLILLDVCFGGKTAKSLEYFLGIKREIQFSVWFVCWMIAFIKFVLDVNLYKGAKTKNEERCQIWLNVTGGVLIMSYVWSIMSLNMFWNFRHGILILLANVALGVIKGFEMLVVYKLIQQMKMDRLDIFTVSASTPRLSITNLNYSSRRPSGVSVDDSRHNASSSTLSEYIQFASPRNVSHF